jgi:very-short-patch-repair endonuclease
MILVENRLWQPLRNRQLGEFKFRRQHPIKAYFVDFYCSACCLVSEVGGGVHKSQVEADRLLQEYLEAQGYQVLRVTNDAIMQDI